MSLRSVLAGLGVQADEVRLLKHGVNSHWLVVAGARRLVLRRYGADRAADSIAWELELTHRIAAAGWPVNAAVAGPTWIGGRLYVLFPHFGGRGLRWPHDGNYRRLGHALAELHEVTSAIDDLAQRPDWRGYVETALPPGGLDERSRMLGVLKRADPVLADEVARISDMAAERLSGLQSLPRRPIHGDFSPWNVRFTGGKLAGLFDFDLCHLDVVAADLAFARRGYHDAVVEGYLQRRTLSDVEIEALHVLWLAAVLDGLWRNLAKGGLTHADIETVRAQFAKTRPYGGPLR